MSFYKVVNGSYPTGTQWNATVLESLKLGSLNLIRELLDREVDFSADGTDFYGEVYTDDDGRLNSVDTFNTTTSFDTNKYLIPYAYVIIEASSVSNTPYFNINECHITELATGKWIITNTNSDIEIQRAKIYETLFYGTNGSNYTILNFTGITSIKTNIVRDVNKKAFLALNEAYNGSGDTDFSGTMNGTTGLSNSIWVYLLVSHSDPTNTVRSFDDTSWFSLGNTNTPVNKFGTDTTDKEKDNPSKVGTTNQKGDSEEVSYVRYLVLSEASSITWNNSGTPHYNKTVDFYNDYNIPAFELATENIFSLIYHNIPSGTFPANISSAYLKAMYADWEDGCSTQFKLLSQDNFDSSTAITNGSFEDPIGSEWTETSGVGVGERVTDKVKNGSYSYKISESGQENIDEIARIEQTVCTIDWYKIKFSNWMNVYKAKAILQIYINDILIYSREAYNSGGTTNDSAWTDVEVDVNSNARFSSATLLIKVQGSGYASNESSSTWIDNFIVNRRPFKEDSGWLDEDELNTFTAFTSEPTTCIVKLIPATGGTAGYPSINGIAYRGTD